LGAPVESICFWSVACVKHAHGGVPTVAHGARTILGGAREYGVGKVLCLGEVEPLVDAAVLLEEVPHDRSAAAAGCARTAARAASQVLA